MIFYEKTHRFSQADVDAYNLMVEDNNPIHYDKEFCANTIFEAPIVPGLLSSSLFGGLLGSNLPDGAILLGMYLKFISPIYIDEKVRARITEVVDDKSVITYNLVCFKYDGVIAIDGTAKVICKRYKFQ